MPKLFDLTTELLTHAIRGTERRHQVISNNIANVDTPNYQPVNYRFEEQLKQVLIAAGRRPNKQQRPLALTDPQWEFRRMWPRVTLARQSEPGLVAETYNEARLDGNPTDIDREMAKLAQNTILHNGFVKLLNAKFRMLRTAMRK